MCIRDSLCPLSCQLLLFWEDRVVKCNYPFWVEVPTTTRCRTNPPSRNRLPSVTHCHWGVDSDWYKQSKFKDLDTLEATMNGSISTDSTRQQSTHTVRVLTASTLTRCVYLYVVISRTVHSTTVLGLMEWQRVKTSLNAELDCLLTPTMKQWTTLQV